MRTGTEKFGTVAPWFDITNSRQRYWIRTHRWKNPEFPSECTSELFAVASPGGNVIKPIATGDLHMGIVAPVEL